MHWLHDIPKHAAWARAWQRHVQATLSALETVRFGEECFVAENVHIFAEPWARRRGGRRHAHRRGRVRARPRDVRIETSR
jgi:hypothetical protein